MILSLVDSFKIGKIDNETYDLSTVKTEGTRQYREITDDTYKVSFYVPANYQMEDDNTENEFTFYEPKNESTSHISLGIYSKTGDTTAYSLATNDHAIREKYASTKYSTLTPVSETGTNSYKYTQTISGSTDSDLYTVDTFFEKGDYVYNFAVTTNLDYDEMEDVYKRQAKAYQQHNTALDEKAVGVYRRRIQGILQKRIYGLQRTAFLDSP